MARPRKSADDVCIPMQISIQSKLRTRIQMHVDQLNASGQRETMSSFVVALIEQYFANLPAMPGVATAPYPQPQAYAPPHYAPQPYPPPAYAPPPQPPTPAAPAPQRPALPFVQTGQSPQLPPIEVYNDDGTLRQSINNGLPLTMSVEDYLELVDPVAAKAMRAKKAAETAATDPSAPKKIEACSIEGVEAQMAGPTGQAVRDREVENAKLRPQAEEMLKRRMEEIDRQNGIHRAPKSGIEK